MLRRRMTGTLINVAAVLGGTGVGTLVGRRLRPGLQERVLAGLGLITLVLGVESALAWQDTNVLYVLGGILLGGIAGELLAIEARIERLGHRVQQRFARDAEHSRMAEGFVTATLLFCVGPLTVVGSIEDGLRGDIDTLVTKATLDGFASIALAAGLGIGVGISALSVLVIQGAITLGAGVFDDVLKGDALSSLESAGGLLIIGIALKLLDVKDVKVGNFLPALVFAPVIAGLAGAVG
jgi:hypothetical protein